MNLNRLGLVGVAAAAALVGCDSGDGEVVKSTPIEITPANAPAVAADGVSLTEGAMDLADVGEPPLAVETSNGMQGHISRGMRLSQIAQIIRGHLDEAAIGGIGALSLPVAVQAAEPVACESGGTRTVTYSGEGSWDITYNQCTYQYAYSYGGESYFHRSVLNGHTSGEYGSSYGGGTWTADYENFSSNYMSDYNGQTYRGNYLMDGQFSSTWTYNYSTYNYDYTYGATGLSVQYDYEYPAEGDYEGGSGSGNIVYDNYEFTFSWNGSQSSWEGYLLARDSTRGQWYINTVTPFVTDYCSREIDGEVVFAGGYYEHEGYGDGAPGNVLHMIGNGDNTVNYDVYNAGGTLISSNTQTWWTGDGDCEMMK